MRRLSFRLEAQTEMFEAAAWYEAEREGLGLRFEQELHKVLARIEEAPRQFPEIEPGARRALLHRFPYAISSAMRRTSSWSWPFSISAASLASGSRDADSPPTVPAQYSGVCPVLLSTSSSTRAPGGRRRAKRRASATTAG